MQACVYLLLFHLTQMIPNDAEKHLQEGKESATTFFQII